MGILIITFIIALAIGDLIVGISNDAVNFLHSAFGSKISSRRTILWISSIGLVIGSFFSIDMLDLTNKGLISTNLLTFHDLISIFIAVLIVDIIILDLCNTFGIPTSTTTALIIELAGAILAISIVKNGSGIMDNMTAFMDINHVFLILSGILFSIAIAFAAGMITQFIARIIFTFNYEAKNKILIPFTGALSITVMFYFVLRKVLHVDIIDWAPWLSHVFQQSNQVFIAIFGSSFFILLLLSNIFSINILKVIVLFGTFTLALSFAANDLVNFIGIPLLGIEKAIDVYHLSGDISFSLSEYFIPIVGLAGIIISITLFYSRKSKAVVDTEIFLGRQFSGYERFEPSYFSRSLVRHAVGFFENVKKFIPLSVETFVRNRYQASTVLYKDQQDNEKIYFDAVRASINLIVSTFLILMGTWSQIPLSTTFIVFLVAMGTSLSDQAWTRENAVYRISGVITVLGSWFLISMLAFIGAFIITLLIWYGNAIAIIVFVLLMGWIIFKSTKYFREQQKHKEEANEILKQEINDSTEWIYDKGEENLKRYLLETSKIFFLTINGLIDYDIVKLKEAGQKARDLKVDVKDTKQNLFQNLLKMTDQSIESGYHLIQALDYVSEMTGCLFSLNTPVLEHIDNNHKGLNEDQIRELNHLLDEVMAYFNFAVHVVKDFKMYNLDEMTHKQHLLIRDIEAIRKAHIRRIKNQLTKAKISLIYMEILSETKNIILYTKNIIKSHRDFISSSNF